jgi:hypothetical protein
MIQLINKSELIFNLVLDNMKKDNIETYEKSVSTT